MVDVEKLRLALKLTEKAAEEGLWDQRSWLKNTECGTAACFAGNWAIHQGATPLWNACGDAAIVMLPSGRPVEIWDYVQTDLGLSREQAANLFAIGNDLEDLRELVELYIEEDQSW